MAVLNSELSHMARLHQQLTDLPLTAIGARTQLSMDMTRHILSIPSTLRQVYLYNCPVKNEQLFIEKSPEQ
jgi:hypothetical protein